MKRFRLSTLLLLVVIVALSMALAIQHRQSTRREAELLARMAQEKDFADRRNELNMQILRLEMRTQLEDARHQQK
jgi:hypothetical protein